MAGRWCPGCGDEFFPTERDNDFCSWECFENENMTDWFEEDGDE